MLLWEFLGLKVVGKCLRNDGLVNAQTRARIMMCSLSGLVVQCWYEVMRLGLEGVLQLWGRER